MFSTVLKKFGDKLIYANPAHEVLYKTFVNSLGEGQPVELFFDANKDDASLAQLAKAHKCIREIAKEVGETFEDTKLEIKKASGLCVVKVIDGEKYIYCKSLGDCSKEDLSAVIETIIQRGDFLRMNLR